jgi:hypothetical protein
MTESRLEPHSSVLLARLLTNYATEGLDFQILIMYPVVPSGGHINYPEMYKIAIA